MDAHGCDRPKRNLDDPMIGRLAGSDDPFEGVGALRRRRRIRVEGYLALGMAIVACGLTAAAWIGTLVPLAGRLGLG